MSAPTSAACSKSARELETPQSSSVTSSAADHLQAGRCELRPALDLEQRVRVGDDLVPPGHAHSLEALRARAFRGRGAGTLWALGVWRSLVARSVRVGEVPSSNLGTPICSQAGDPPRGGHRPRTSPRVGRRPGLCSAERAAGRPLRRRLHALAARAGARARGVPAGRGTRTGSASTRRATRTRGSRPSRTCGRTPSSCTTRRSGSHSPRTSSAAWAATPTARAPARSRSSAAGRSTPTSTSTTTPSPCSRRSGATGSGSG